MDKRVCHNAGQHWSYRTSWTMQAQISFFATNELSPTASYNKSKRMLMLDIRESLLFITSHQIYIYNIPHYVIKYEMLFHLLQTAIVISTGWNIANCLLFKQRYFCRQLITQLHLFWKH
jgi:hypothetical protein